MHSITQRLLNGTLVVSLAALIACAEKTEQSNTAAAQELEKTVAAIEEEEVAQFAQVESATATLNPTEGNATAGAVTFEPNADQTAMRVTLKVTGLSPGDHGFHIHEIGDCSAPDGKSAGGHFNPAASEHGAPGSAAHHVGDLGNITADEEGDASAEIEAAELSFSGDNSILNKAVIVHADADDLNSQPTGAAGARIACGVIHLDRDKLLPE
ncbi:MAG: superoxide dismutase family protein [Pseudomonadales bacterium]